jgi:hypothetical protein
VKWSQNVCATADTSWRFRSWKGLWNENVIGQKERVMREV